MIQLQGLTPQQQKDAEAVVTAQEANTPSPVSKQAIEQIIADHVDALCAASGYALAPAVVAARFMTTSPIGQALGNAALRCDTPDEPEAEPAPPPMKKSLEYLNAALKPAAERLAKSQGIGFDAAANLILHADPSIYDKYLDIQREEEAQPVAKVLPAVAEAEDAASRELIQKMHVRRAAKEQARVRRAAQKS